MKPEFLIELLRRPASYQLYWLYMMANAEKTVRLSDASHHAGVTRVHGARMFRWGIETMGSLKVFVSVKEVSLGVVMISFRQVSAQKQIDDTIAREKEEKIDKIIEYLNRVAEKKYRTDVISNRKVIGAIIAKYGSAEIKKVIDRKVAQWKGNSKMEKYIRPQTLFKADKFEAYLNESDNKNKKPESREEQLKNELSLGEKVASRVFPASEGQTGD